MTRDTDPYAHTELRDLVSSQPHPSSSSSSSSAPTLNPTWVLPASITTIHPQLRDLIVCPKERGRVYYVQGKGVTEMVVDSAGERDGTNNVAGGGWNPKRTYKPFSNLLFTPNCLTTSSTLLACGGQNGELHLTTLPSNASSSPMISSSSPYRPLSPPGARRQREESPWSMTMTLPNTSINNSFLLLPAYRGNTPLPTRASSPVTNHYRNGVRSGSYIPDGNSMQTGLGIATYPNSVPFGSTDRDEVGEDDRDQERDRDDAAAADGDDGGARYLSSGSGSAARFMPWTVRAEPMSHWYTAREDLRRRRRESRTASSDLYAEMHDGEDSRAGIFIAGEGNNGNGGGDTGWTTVLPPNPESITRGHRDVDDGEDWEGYQTIFPPVATTRSGFSPPPVRYGRRTGEAVRNAERPVGFTALGSSPWQLFAGPSTARSAGNPRGASMTEQWPDWTPTDTHPWRVVAASATTAGRDLLVPPATTTYNPERARRPVRNRPSPRSTIEYESTRYPIREDEPRLLVSNNDMSVKLFAIRNAKTTTSNPPLRWGEIQNKGPGKKLANIGGTKFQTAVNHASVSPDGTTMLVVGDTNDVFLYEVRSGGRDFNKIARYEGSRDAGFSTSWSADGRKFAVASQDGQVTVWDHRSSKPLAKLYTSRSPTRASTYGVDNLYWGEGSEPDSPTPYVSPTTITPSRPGAPTSPPRGGVGRRDPARVVKFSPAGSGRELLVFSEETDHIHIADARTFDAQITLRVPLKAPGGQTIWGDDPSHVRTAPDRGRIGIAGLCFDERGDYLYAGTESSIVEYDLRLETKRGSGYSSVI